MTAFREGAVYVIEVYDAAAADPRYGYTADGTRWIHVPIRAYRVNGVACTLDEAFDALERMCGWSHALY